MTNVFGTNGRDFIHRFGDGLVAPAGFNDVLGASNSADFINGGPGADQMYGGFGDDVYVVDNSGDQVFEFDGEGVDTVSSTISYTLGANVERLQLLGNAANGLGNGLANRIIGNSANNILNGAGGADVMAGRAGNDTYFVAQAGDQVSELAGEGNDLVNSSITYSLTANVERLQLIGSGAINGFGNNLANVITGNGAANFINGGAGADRMEGGGGNDTYVVDNSGDVIVELFGQGNELVSSSVSFVLSANVERLTLVGSAAINGFGNDLANSIFGNAAANFINGGTGADMMLGGDGNEVYIVENAGDQALEYAGQGFDKVAASISYVLGTNLEVLQLTGSAAINGFGNTLANNIFGNAAANFIDGRGGADYMAGGGGNDIYAVDNAGDVVHEGVSQGYDTIQLNFAANAYHLTANVERLNFGSSAHNASGNDLDNLIVGNSLGNALDGGLGADTLLGGGGNDILYGDDGADHLIGEAGDDVFNYLDSSQAQGDFIDGGAGNDTLSMFRGGVLDFTATQFSGVENLSGSFSIAFLTAQQMSSVTGLVSGFDVYVQSGGVINIPTMTLNFASIHLSNQATALFIGGGDVDSRIIGGASSDAIVVTPSSEPRDWQLAVDGGGGNDTLAVAQGFNDLTGGAGADRFQFVAGTTSNGIIEDFSGQIAFGGGAGQGDRISLDDSIVGAFVYRGAAAFTGGGDNTEARFDGTHLLIDINGDATAEFSYQIVGMTNAGQINGGDFIFV